MTYGRNRVGAALDKIFLIGGSPSSGSSLLVSLLGNQPRLLCLPETGLFVHGRNLVDLSLEPSINDLGWYVPWVATPAKLAHALGWNAKEYEKAVQSGENAFTFLRSQVDAGQDFCLVEKTPENIFAFARYLEMSPKNRVLVTSRDALSVTQSLMRRGFKMREALLAWFGHSYETLRLLRAFPDQVYHCQYERLTREADVVLAEIMTFMEPYLADIADSTQASAGPARGKAEAFEEITFLLEFANRKLVGAAWSHSPSEGIVARDAVNMLGLPFEALYQRAVFKTPDESYASAKDVDAALQNGEFETLGQLSAKNVEPMDITLQSQFTRCLAEAYAPHFLKVG